MARSASVDDDPVVLVAQGQGLVHGPRDVAQGDLSLARAIGVRVVARVLLVHFHLLTHTSIIGVRRTKSNPPRGFFSETHWPPQGRPAAAPRSAESKVQGAGKQINKTTESIDGGGKQLDCRRLERKEQRRGSRRNVGKEKPPRCSQPMTVVRGGVSRNPLARLLVVVVCRRRRSHHHSLFTHD